MLRALIAFTSLTLLACPVEKPAATHMASAGGPASQPASAPASQPASAPASQPASAPAVENGKPFSGLVKLAEGLPADAVKPSDVLFVMARQAVDGKPAGLVAVQRHVGMAFPLRYEVSAQDLMMPGTPFAGPFVVQARLDRDGDPMTKGDDDLYGEVSTPVESGQEGVHVTLAPRAAP